METIRNLLSSNKTDNETPHDPNQTTSATGLTGERSHFESNRNTVGEGSHLAGARDQVGTGKTLDNAEGRLTGTGVGHSHQSNPSSAAELGPNISNTQQTGLASTASNPIGHTGQHSSTIANTQAGNSSGTATGGIGGSQNAAFSNTPNENQYGTSSHNQVGSNSSSGTSGTALGSGQASGYPGSTTGITGTTGGAHTSTLPDRSVGVSKSQHSADHHLGRDTAAVGTAGVVREGIHQHQQQHNTGTSENLSASHSTRTATLLDPTINTRGSSLEDAHHHDPVHGGGAEEADHHHSGRQQQTGRDTAFGAGAGAGALGLAEHEHRKHETVQGSALGSSGIGSSGVGSSGVGSSGVGSSGVGSSNVESSTTGLHDSKLTDRHLGRDAAIGAGGAGLAEHEHRKHESVHGSGAAPVATGNHDSSSNDRHLGRDATIGAGIGGAAYEADKHHKHDKDLSAAEKEAKKEHKHEVKEEKKDHKQELKEQKKLEKEEEKHEHKEKKGGLLSFLHRDKDKKNTHDGEETSTHHQQNPGHHTGRDVAVGGAGAGAAYEAEKHHGQHNAAASHEGHAHGAVPLAEKPTGTDIGDKLHGTARNRGVAGSSGFPGSEGFGSGETGTGTTSHTDQHHLGRDAAVGAGGIGLAEHEHRKHETTGQQTGLVGQQNYSTGQATGHQTDLTGHHNLTEQSHPSGQATGEQTGLSSATGQTYPSGQTTGQHTGLTSATGPTTGQQTGLSNEHNLTGQSYPSGQTTSSNHGPSTHIGDDGRNRLHKEPPAGHAASQAQHEGVPASKSERENLISQGENRLDKDTGVANSQNTTSTSNY